MTFKKSPSSFGNLGAYMSAKKEHKRRQTAKRLKVAKRRKAKWL
jgi:hypothetical protein